MKRRFYTGGATNSGWPVTPNPGYYEPQITGSKPVPGQPGSSIGSTLPEPPVAPMATPNHPTVKPIAGVKGIGSAAEEDDEDTTAGDLKKRIRALEKDKDPGGMFAHIQSPWKRALLAGGLGAGMSSGAGGWGALGGGALAAGLTALLGRKKAQGAAKGGVISKEGSMQMSKGRTPGRRLRFQVGGEVPPVAGSLPPGLPPVAPAGLPPGPLPGPVVAPPAGPIGGPPPGSAGGPPPIAPPPGPPAPMGAPPPPGLADVAAPPPGPPGPPAAPVPLPQVAAPGAAIGAGLPSASPDTLRQGLGSLRGPRPGMKKGGKVKTKGVLTRRPKVSISIAKKKSPVPTPSPYDIDAPEPPAPPAALAKAEGGKVAEAPLAKAEGGEIVVKKAEGGKIAAKKAKGGKFTMRKRHGGKCDDTKKMAAGGVAKVRKGFPNVNAKPQKLAHGGKVRGCGAATKGTSFSGIF